MFKLVIFIVSTQMNLEIFPFYTAADCEVKAKQAVRSYSYRGMEAQIQCVPYVVKENPLIPRGKKL